MSEQARRTYSQKEKSEAIAHWAVSGENVGATAKDRWIPGRTLRRWIVEYKHRARAIAAAPIGLRARNIFNLCEDIMNKAMAVIPSKLEDATLPALTATVQVMSERAALIQEFRFREMDFCTNDEIEAEINRLIALRESGGLLARSAGSDQGRPAQGGSDSLTGLPG